MIYFNLLLLGLASAVLADYHLLDEKDSRAHPDGTDMLLPVVVDDEGNEVDFTDDTLLLELEDSDQEPVTNSRERRTAVRDKNKLWQDGIIYYSIDERLEDWEKCVVNDAMRHWEDKTCIRFIPKSTVNKNKVRNSIHITYGACCCTYVGRQKMLPTQYVYLKPSDCFYFSTVVHELGHAIGFYHEMNRPDRDEHIEVFLDNIKPNNRFNFDILDETSVDTLGTEYDPYSVMHYADDAFSINGGRTIELKKGWEMYNGELSELDIFRTRLMYHCPLDPETDPPKTTVIPDTCMPKKKTYAMSSNGPCKYWLENDNGHISSPVNGRALANNLECGWLIKAPKGYNVEVTFSSIKFDYEPWCGDKVELYDGDKSNGWKVKTLCGVKRNYVFKTIGPVAYIELISDGFQGQSAGFNATYRFVDEDECSSYADTKCQYKCRNTPGSFECLCPTGLYAPDMNKFICIDHNECTVNNGGCSHTCVNEWTSHHCECPPEMKLGTDERTCVPKNRAGCPRRCPSGKRLSREGGVCRCVDIDECALRISECCYGCINTNGSFTCTCPDGYTLSNDNRTCEEDSSVDECQGCSHGCEIVDGIGHCTCTSGYRLSEDDRTCEDINECSARTAGCSHRCVNTPGSFRCECPSGYQLSGNEKTCTDINECSAGTAGCSHRCVNTPGSFRCECPSGYQLSSNEKTCTDINECSARTAGCSHRCVNTPGSFRCECPSGYQLSSNRKTCTDINECSARTAGCSHRCVNTPGSFRCECPSGYQLSGNRKTCTDINECSARTAGCSHRCVNTPGSFRCECPSGYQLSGNRKTCTDINECSARTAGCSHRCVNTPGSFRCECPSGYQLSGNRKTCTDINECSASTAGCSHRCVNTPGSFRCECPSGYQLSSNGKTCTDVNECRGSHGCSHICRNTQGSFTCKCRPGYSLNTDKRSCSDIDECEDNPCNEGMVCTNTEGSYKCTRQPAPEALPIRTPSSDPKTTPSSSTTTPSSSTTTPSRSTTMPSRSTTMPSSSTTKATRPPVTTPVSDGMGPEIMVPSTSEGIHVPMTRRQGKGVLVAEEGRIISLNLGDLTVVWTPNCSNYVEIRNGETSMAPLIGRYCGRGPTVFNSTVPRMFVRWSLQEPSGQCIVKTVAAPNLEGQCGYAFDLSTGSVDIALPNFPNLEFSSRDCSWIFLAKRKHKVSVTLEYIDEFQFNEGDYIEMSQGRFSKDTLAMLTGGTYQHYYESSARMVTVTLHMASTPQFRGLQARVSQIAK